MYCVVLYWWLFCRRLSTFGLSGTLSEDIQSLSALQILYAIYFPEKFDNFKSKSFMEFRMLQYAREEPLKASLITQESWLFCALESGPYKLSQNSLTKDFVVKLKHKYYGLSMVCIQVKQLSLFLFEEICLFFL